jgi:hypothetical protein
MRCINAVVFVVETAWRRAPGSDRNAMMYSQRGERGGGGVGRAPV